MDLNEPVTVAKIYIKNEHCFLLVGWQSKSFEMYLYAKEKLWKGHFSSKRLSGFSKNLHLTEDEYLTRIKGCLTEAKDNFSYELISGFFYWKRMLNGSQVIEGFLPVEEDKSSRKLQPDLIEVLLAINKYLKDKVMLINSQYNNLKAEYKKCLTDTEEFLNLKVDMEKALCEKFLNLLYMKQSKMKPVNNKEIQKSH